MDLLKESAEPRTLTISEDIRMRQKRGEDIMSDLMWNLSDPALKVQSPIVYAELFAIFEEIKAKTDAFHQMRNPHAKTKEVVRKTREKTLKLVEETPAPSEAEEVQLNVRLKTPQERKDIHHKLVEEAEELDQKLEDNEDVYSFPHGKLIFECLLIRLREGEYVVEHQQENGKIKKETHYHYASDVTVLFAYEELFTKIDEDIPENEVFTILAPLLSAWKNGQLSTRLCDLLTAQLIGQTNVTDAGLAKYLDSIPSTLSEESRRDAILDELESDTDSLEKFLQSDEAKLIEEIAD